jgi:hypothetical protein
VKGFVDLAFEDVPRIPLFQPYLNVAMQKNVTGYRYWFHRQLDYRSLAKAEAGTRGAMLTLIGNATDRLADCRA